MSAERKESLVLKGSVVCPGVVESVATVILEDKDLNQVSQGDIVVLPTSGPIYAMALMKASGLVCEKGGRLSHICTVAMEMGIPCVTKVKDATKFIKSGQTVSIDGNNSGEEGIVVVYE